MSKLAMNSTRVADKSSPLGSSFSRTYDCIDIRDTNAVSEYGFLHPAIVDNINHRVDFVTVHLITIVLTIMFYYICAPSTKTYPSK